MMKTQSLTPWRFNRTAFQEVIGSSITVPQMSNVYILYIELRFGKSFRMLKPYNPGILAMPHAVLASQYRLVSLTRKSI
jgi:hypothetical protein